MTKTENYQLPQWEAGDPARVGELSGAMAGIDAGLNAAQDTADAARSAASAAQAAADAAMEKARERTYATGLYLGAGAEQTITLGFHPALVVICGDPPGANSQTMGHYSAAPVDQAVWHGMIQFHDDGFTLKYGGTSYPRINEKGHVYTYAAFR